MPKELQDYINSLPPQNINNSRVMVKRMWEKAKDKHPVSAEWMMARVGFPMEADYCPFDDGNYRNNNEE